MSYTWILLIGGVVLLVTPGSAALEGTPGIGGFAGRQTIAIDHPSGTEGLEVFFNATYLPGMRPDFADIRFQDGNGTAIPHWTATVTKGSHAHVWLALPANATTITMLYGNPAALDASDPDAVFLFFEDYERGNLSRRSFYGSNAAIRSDAARSGRYAGDINVSEPDLRQLANNRICLANISAGPIVVEGDFLISEFGVWCGSGYIQAWNGTNRLYALHLRNGSVQYYDGAHWNFSADAPVEEETWYHIKVVLDTPNATGHAWIDGRYLGNMILRFADASLVPEETIFTDVALIGSSAWDSGDSHHFCADNVVVRNYVPVESVLFYERNAPGCAGDS